MNLRKARVFLDDLRKVDEVFPEAAGWIVVRNYNEFEIVLNTFLPIQISFDHDLGDEKTYSNPFARNGSDCMSLFIDKLMNYEKEIGEKEFKKVLEQIIITVHSANDSGARNIKAKWDTFTRTREVDNPAMLI